jgi:hypothetical protein
MQSHAGWLWWLPLGLTQLRSKLRKCCRKLLETEPKQRAELRRATAGGSGHAEEQAPQHKNHDKITEAQGQSEWLSETCSERAWLPALSHRADRPNSSWAPKDLSTALATPPKRCPRLRLGYLTEKQQVNKCEQVLVTKRKPLRKNWRR